MLDTNGSTTVHPSPRNDTALGGLHALVCATLLLLGGLVGCAADEPGREPGAGHVAAPADAVTLVFSYGSEKQKWLAEATTRFERSGATLADGRPIRVDLRPTGSGEAIDDLLSGRVEAHLTSPASAAFIEIGNARSRARTGSDLVGPTQPLVLSPVVLAMWRPMAEALGWGERALGWQDILDLARSEQGWSAYGFPQWGEFKFGHTHPRFSNSGLISILAEVYAGSGKVAGLTVDDVRAAEVARFVGDIERSVVHYGSSTGFFGRKMFANGPGYLSAAVLYENMVIESYAPEHQLPFPIVAVYPREGTFWSDHPAAIVERSWVTPAHREAAEIYLGYLLARQQQERAMLFGFRPADPAIPLAAPFDAAHGVDPREPQTTLEVPSVEVMDAILALWQEQKKRSDVVLVLDTSGSMQGARLAGAKQGALEMLAMLSDDDRIGIIAFSTRPAWLAPPQKVGDARDALRQQLTTLFADGETSLYDAIAAAHASQAEGGDERIRAIVVLTDGEDTASRIALPSLLEALRQSQEGAGVRVFTIGYGASAQRDVLEAVADATRARAYEGETDTVRAVFRDISTFF